MGWIIAYLASLVLIPIVVISFAINEDSNIRIKNGTMWRRVLIAWLLWPGFLLVACPYLEIKKHLEEKLREAAMEVKYRIKLDGNKHDRSDIVIIAEKDLKLLLKAFRKKLVELDKNQVEIIRDELMHRTAENQLLR